VVDDEVAWDEGIHFLGIATHADHRGTHRSEIDDAGNAGEILQDDAAGHKGDFGFSDVFGVVSGEGFDGILGDDEAVEVTQAGLKENFDGVGEFVDVAKRFEGVEAEDGLVAGGGGESGFGVEGAHGVAWVLSGIGK